MSTTTQELRKAIYHKVNVARQAYDVRGRREFRKGITLSFERSRLLTQSYKQSEGEPEVIRRAKAIAYILDNMTLYIKPGQKLVGNPSANPWSMELFPELAVKWVNDEMHAGLEDRIDEQGKKDWEEISEYWQGKCLDDRVNSYLPDSLKEYVDFNGVCHANHWRMALSAQAPNYKKVLNVGLKKIVAEAEKRLQELKSDLEIKPDEYIRKSNFLEAVIISCEGLIRYARRFSEKAMEMASSEVDAVRKKELEEIAYICKWVPENPPRTLYEAMQCFWFVFVVNKFIELRGQGIGVRIDQLMYPYYKSDIEQGKTTRDNAQELIEMLFIEVEEAGLPSPRDTGQGGVSWFPTFTIGGVTPEGDDATNEISFIILDAAMNMMTSQTNLALRYHSKISNELILKAIDVVRSGLGYPAFFNDNTYIQFALQRGFSLEEARDYAIRACVNWLIPGKNCRQYPASDAVINLAKCLELALNQGFDEITKRQLGCPTPAPKEFKSHEDVMNAYLEQVRFIVDKITRICNLAHELRSLYLPCPFTSSLLDGCIERGEDYHSWAESSYALLLPAGSTNVADSLAAIKKFVFEEKKLSMEDLLEALRDDFNGNEELRQSLINEVPKFGNDDDYVDLIAREVHHRTQDVVEQFNNVYGYSWTLDGSLAGGYYPWGRRVRASAEGRKNKESLADAVLSPMAGRDRSGPTAVLKSMSKVSGRWHELANQRFLPQYLEGDDKEKFAAYLKTWFDLGNSHIQFNVADEETLVEAQKHPEDYMDLVVRVAGYSAYFVDLSRGLQDDIIARTAQRY